MASNQESEPLSPIDNDLFHYYTRYQLCQLSKSTSLWTCSEEKQAMLSILGQFESIDGNTLRMVVNQIFENSTQTCNSGDTNETSMGYQRGSSSALALESPPSSSSTTISAKVSNNEAAQDGAWASSTITSIMRPGRSKLIQKHPVAGKKKTFDPIIKKLKQIVSSRSLEELVDLTNHTERSKYVILTRMRRVSTSFTFKASAGPANCSLHVSNSLGSPRSPMSLCQMNLIAYQFGKLLEQEERFESDDAKKKKAVLECYQIIREELNAHGKRIATPAWKYVRYALNVVKTAEKIGVYALFLPEFLSPYALQIVTREKFPVFQSCLSVKCAEFKEIAHFDCDGNLVMAEMKYSHKHSDKSYRHTKNVRYSLTINYQLAMCSKFNTNDMHLGNVAARISLILDGTCVDLTDCALVK